MKRLLLAAALLATPASAQDATREATLGELSKAAGYKAMFTCSAMFNAGKTLDQIAEDELRHTYDIYEAQFGAVGKPVVDADAKTVSVSWSDAMPPRISAWREHVGCSALPPGADIDVVRYLPRVKMRTPKRDADALWPEGDHIPNSLPITDAQKTALDAAIDRAFTDLGGRTSAVVIVHDGQIVGERYRDGFDVQTSQRTWSVAKSVAASVIGAAVHDGLINIDAPAGLEAWSRPGDPRGAITTADLLHMNSGLNSDPAGNRTDEIYVGGGLVADHAMREELDAPPGTRWRYANNDTMLVMRALREKMGNDKRYHAYPFRAVLHRIGMFDTVPEMDWGGDYVMSSQVWTTARDMARLGQLYLQDGVWEGERILARGWTEFVASDAPVQAHGTPDMNPDGPYRGYGAQFWLYKNYEGIPDDTYAASGNRGQSIIIVPSRNTVIVRRGYDYRGERLDTVQFIREVFAALE